jgi:hypothetical protein
MKVSLAVLVAGPLEGKRIPITIPRFIIGRASQCHLQPGDPTIGERHCVLEIVKEEVLVRDLGSATGTYVNEGQIQGTCQLKHGDRLKVGPLLFGLVIEEANQPSPSPTSAETNLKPAADAIANKPELSPRARAGREKVSRPVQVDCPGCGSAFSFSQGLIGRTTRCENCKAFLTVGDPPVAQELDDDALLQAEDADDSAPSKKKRRGERRPAAGAGWKVGLLMTTFLAFVGSAVTLVVFFDIGADRGPDLIGEWRGAPEMIQVVNDAMKDAPDFAKNFAAGMVQKAADEVLGVTMQFNESGQVFVSGNTSCLGLAGALDGRWEVLERNGNVLRARLDFGGDPFDVRLAFRSRRTTFTFTRLDRNDQPVVFTRGRN